jgi:hypothetical protein
MTTPTSPGFGQPFELADQDDGMQMIEAWMRQQRGDVGRPALGGLRRDRGEQETDQGTNDDEAVHYVMPTRDAFSPRAP